MVVLPLAAGFLAGLIPPWFRWALLALVLVAIFAAGERFGAGRMQAKWDRATLELERRAAAQRQENDRIAQAAASAYQATHATITRRQPEVRRALRQSLAAPASCPASAVLADVVIPAGAVSRLRDAGAPPDADQPAAR